MMSVDAITKRKKPKKPIEPNPQSFWVVPLTKKRGRCQQNQIRPRMAFVYLVIIATVGLYYLYLFVLSRWPASVTNYSFSSPAEDMSAAEGTKATAKEDDSV